MIPVVKLSGYLPISDLESSLDSFDGKHNHVFINKNHRSVEFRTWLVIILCCASVVIEITAGILFGSLSLVADGICTSTLCIGFFITTYAYSYALQHRKDSRFVFGTGKISELTAYTSGTILIIIALFLFCEGLNRILHPQPIQYSRALPIAFIGLCVKVISLVFNFSDRNGINGDASELDGVTHGLGPEQTLEQHGSNNTCTEEDNPFTFKSEEHHAQGQQDQEHDHDHDRSHSSLSEDTHDVHLPLQFRHLHGSGHVIRGHKENQHVHTHNTDDKTIHIETPQGTILLSIVDTKLSSRSEFRIHFAHWSASHFPSPKDLSVTVEWDAIETQVFRFTSLVGSEMSHGGVVFHSTDAVPRPHEFQAVLRLRDGNTVGLVSEYTVQFRAPPAARTTHTIRSHHGNDNLSVAVGIELASRLNNHHHNNTNYDKLHNHSGSHGSTHSDAQSHQHEHTLSYQQQTSPADRNRTTDLNYDFSAENIGINCSIDSTTTSNKLSDHSTSLSKLEEGHSFFCPSSKSNTTNTPNKYQLDISDRTLRCDALHMTSDLFLSLLVIAALCVMGRYPSMYFLDPLVGMMGSLVIFSWAYITMFSASRNLLDMTPDAALEERVRGVIEKDGGTKVNDLHIWRLGPGHLGAILSLSTPFIDRDVLYFRRKLSGFKTLTHLSIEVICERK